LTFLLTLVYHVTRYFLDAVSPTPSFGGFFGSSPAKVAPSPAPKSVPQPDINTKMQQLAEERKAAAEARKIEAAEKREAALEAAEAKKQEAAEKRALLDANRKQEAEERRQAQEAVRKEQASKAAEAAEARKRGVAERAAAKVRTSPQEAARKKQAAKAAVEIAKAKPGGTISLGFLNFGQSDKDDSDEPTIVSSAPRGVPTLSKWKRNFDGSITGFISGEYISMISRCDY
jgi:flagellar biosynthesis GTPase FlhF